MELEVSQIPESLAADELSSALLELRPKFFSFLVNFWVIGSYRPAHHRIFHHVRAYDRGMLLINLLLLMWIVLMPFLQSLIGEYENLQLPTIVYAGPNILARLTLLWLWRPASKDERLSKTKLDPQAARYNNLWSLFLPIIFVVPIGWSFISVELARGFWLLVFLAGPYWCS